MKSFVTLMRDRGLLEKDKQFAMASGRFQRPSTRRKSKRICGRRDCVFQLLDLHEYRSGQALVVELDAFWEEKGYITRTVAAILQHDRAVV
jgi:hypothetical protein